MSIWGSLIGGFVGFSFAGPIGALIGSMVGGRISSARRSGFQKNFTPPRQVFAISLITVIDSNEISITLNGVRIAFFVAFCIARCLVSFSFLLSFGN